MKLERNNPVLSFWELSPYSPGDLILFPAENENTPLYSKPASLNISLTFSIIRVLLGAILLLVINTMNKCCGYLGKKNSSAFKPLVRFGFLIETYTLVPCSICIKSSSYKVYSIEKLIHFEKNGDH